MNMFTLSLALAVSAAAAAAPERPSFVILLADDVGAGDVGYACVLNSTVCPKTPNIDAMASGPNTLLLNRFYAGAGVCSPTRASVLTGRTNRRSCIGNALPCDHMNPAWSCSMGPGIARGEFTVAHAVKRANPSYMTLHLGKWHLGDFWNKKDPAATSGFSSPGSMGFDEWQSTQAQTSISVPNCGCFPPPGWTPPAPPPDFPTAPPKEFPHTFPGANCIVAGGIYVNESFNCANYWFPSPGGVGGVANLTEKLEGDDGDFLVSRLDDFVGRASAAGRPFLVALWTHYIHLPHPAMPDYYKDAVASGDPDYIGALAQFDNAVGRVRSLLQAHGVANNTLLWLTSDNGPHCTESPLLCGGPIGHGRSNAGLRGCKASVWEGGIRVPGIVEWPAGIASHRATAVPAVTMDVLPTVMDILAVNSTHPSWPLDGVSLVPFFAADPDAVPKARSTPIGFWWGSSFAWIDNDVKIIGDPTPGAKAATVGDGQGCVAEPPYVGHPARTPLMFNLSASPTESEDIHAAQPELFARLSAAFLAWTQSVTNSTEQETFCGGHGPGPSPPPGPPPPPSTNCTFTQDTLGFGADGWMRNVSTKEACCALCLADPKCTVAVFRGTSCHGKTPETKPGHHQRGAWACRARPPP